jgi:hypothetical protein
LLVTSSLRTHHLLMINEHVYKELSIIKILRFLIGQVSHDSNLLEQFLGKMNDIISLNLKIVE